MAYRSKKLEADAQARRTLVALGKQIRLARKERGFTQESLAIDCGVERSYLGAAERGEVNLTLELLSRICRGMGIKMSDLLADARL